MILLKPSWIRHEEDKPIFSVDIHPKGGRFATGGQGGQGGRIVIWNLAPVLSEADEADQKIPKQLCQMDNHLGCVNVVRWSCQGHLLASGSDDKLVMIWKLTGEGSSTIFGGGGKVNIETWKCVYTLNCHSGDVLDLAWAPHDGWLASASVDNTVIIWNAMKFPEKVSVLKGHTSMVKGVTWDPVGKYIASQSDDKSLRVWRTCDWQQQEVVTDAFVDCSATTHVLRLSWSPDGQYLVSAHAMNGGGPTAQIIERDGWKQDKDFVGHRKAVTCVRFNSNILKKVSQGSPKTQQYCCCAVGSRDRSLSIWLTSLKRPLVVIKDLFDDSVLDISWSSNGLHLLACSWDGSVACVIFRSEEVGIPLSETEKDSLYERIYGKSLQRNLLNSSFVGSQIIENPDMLSALDEEINIKTKQQKAQNESISIEIPKSSVSQVSNSMQQQSLSPYHQLNTSSSSILMPVNQQVETRLPDGKRRIKPMALKPVPTTPTNEVPSGLIQPSATFSSSSPTKSKIVVVREESQSSSTPQTNFTQFGSISQTSSNAGGLVVTKSHHQQIKLNKRTHTQIIHQQSLTQPPGVEINQLSCSIVPGDQPIIQYISILDSTKMVPGQTSVVRRDQFMKLQVTNDCLTTARGKLSRIEIFKTPDDKLAIWETYLGSTIRCLKSNRRHVIACCEDLSINAFFVKSGARCLPPIVLEDTAAALCLNEGGICMVLSRTGLVHVWNVDQGRAVLSRLSVRGLLTKKVSVSSCALTSTDQPLITLTDGRAYSYHVDLQSWILLSNPEDPLYRASFNVARSPLADSLGQRLPLASLQRHLPNSIGGQSSIGHNVNGKPNTSTGSSANDASLPSGVALSFLESQLANSLLLESAGEFKHWLFVIVNHLLDKGPECRLRFILDDLMVCSYAGHKRTKSDNILGLCKKTLLNEVLALIKTKLPWQRIYKEYSEQLALIS